jgi:hypothetical protein
MIAVNSFDHFEFEFNKRKNERDLFSFLLFDDRESHESIKKDVAAQQPANMSIGLQCLKIHSGGCRGIPHY